MNQSKLYDTDLKGLEFRIKGKNICFVINGKPNWFTLSDRVAKKINDLIIEQNAVEKAAKVTPKYPGLTAPYACLSYQTNYMPIMSNDGWPGPQGGIAQKHYGDEGK